MHKINFSFLQKPLLQKIAFIIFGICSALIIIELGLRIGGRAFFYSQELRNQTSLKQKGEYRILCLGESTTAFGGKYSWPAQLEKILNDRNVGVRFKIINKGIPGCDSSVQLSHLNNNLKMYSPNLVVAMLGINDGRGVFDYSANMQPNKLKLFFTGLRVYKLTRIFWVNLICRVNKFCKLKMSSVDRKTGELISETNISLASVGNNNEQLKQKAIELDPRNSAAYINLGDCFYKNMQYQKAETMYQKAIELDPSNHVAYTSLGVFYARQRQYVKAEELLNKAKLMYPDDSAAAVALEGCYRNQQRNPELIKMYKRLIVNYRRIKEILNQNNIQLVCVQYPRCNINSLKMIFQDQQDGIIFVDNEQTFEGALEKESYSVYFTDMFANNFGHCTAKGNRLLAENIAKVILKEIFGK